MEDYENINLEGLINNMRQDGRITGFMMELEKHDYEDVPFAANAMGCIRRNYKLSLKSHHLELIFSHYTREQLTSAFVETCLALGWTTTEEVKQFEA
jgi:hypothetical protein